MSYFILTICMIVQGDLGQFTITETNIGKFPTHLVQREINTRSKLKGYCGVTIKGVSIAGKIDNENLTGDLFHG